MSNSEIKRNISDYLFNKFCWFMYVTERAPNDTGYMWRAHADADALASVIDSVAGHGCVSKKCYQIWQFSVKWTTFLQTFHLQTFFKHFVFRSLSNSKILLNLSFQVRGDRMSKILVGMSLYDGLNPAPWLEFLANWHLSKESGYLMQHEYLVKHFITQF